MFFLDNIFLYEWERVDDLQYKGLKIIQDKRNFCFGVDAVILSNFADVRMGDKVLDLGTGTGIIPILIAGKTSAEHITGLEIQTSMASMAKRSVEMNNLQGRVQILEGDLRRSTEIFKTNTFDVITCNPPYKASGGGLLNEDDAKAISRHEIKCTLEDVVSTSSKLLKPGGRLNIVHRPERLVDILSLMRSLGVEPKRLRMVYPSPYKRATMILVEGVKKGGVFLKMLEPLYIHNCDGEYSDEINKIYNREGCV